MSHVDEGTLHAYLDGALDSLPAAQTDHVRRHVAECDVCRARLDEERAVRDEAAAILGGAGLDVGDLPSFEELRARAHAPRPVAAASGMQRLAWAATVVLALGTGWLLRGGIPQPTGPVDALQDRADKEAPTPAEGRGPSPASVPVADEVEAPADAAADAPADAAADAPADAPVATRSAPASKAVADTTATPSATRPADLWAAAQARQSRERPAALQEFILPPPVTSEPSGVSGAAEPRLDQARRAVDVAGSAFGVRAAEPTTTGVSLVVPGLSVVSVTWLEEPDLAGAVRVLQLMEGGDTLELVHLPAGVDPSRLPPRGDGRTEVRAPRDGGWLVMRARTSAEVLSGFLRRLEGGD